MNRRTLLARTGTLAALALAGCLSEGPGGGNDGDGGTEDPPPTDTTTPTPTQEPALADSTFTVLGVSPGEGDNSATVSFGDDVTVEGTIGGNNGCYTAELKSAELADGTLTVVVEAIEEKGEDEMCTQSLVDVEYEATFGFEGPVPGRVVVEHVSGDETLTVADETR